MKKKYDLSEMQNELTTGSVFFQRPKKVDGAKKNNLSPTQGQPGRGKPTGQSTGIVNHDNRPVQSTNKSDQSNRLTQSIQSDDHLNRPAQSTVVVDKSDRREQSTHAVDKLSRRGQLVGPVKKGSPPAFYIPEIINTKIDEAVNYYRETLKLKQVDRTAVVAALLADPDLWTPNSLDKLKDKVVEQFNDRKRRKLEARLA